MVIKSQKDFWSGVMFTIFGVGFALGAGSYDMGTAAKMGPAYFPKILGILLAILGAVIALKALTVETADGDPVGAIAWKPLFLVLAAVASFGLAIKFKLGLIVAIVVMTFLASLADEFKARDVTILAIGLSIFSYAVFVYGLKLPFPVWPEFLVK
jgi:hypothetical protein